MTWLKWLLVAFGLVVALVIVFVTGLGVMTSEKEKEVRHISIGQRTITVSHYKSLTQETTADGVKIAVDGHTITTTPDAIAIDGKVQTFDPTQDVEITIDETGAVQAKALSADASSPDEESPDKGGGDAPPE
jgi:cytoskeletal protein RodZ